MSKYKRFYKHKKTFFNDDETERLLKMLLDQYSLNFSMLMRMLIKKEARFAGLLDYEGQRKPGT